MKKYLILIVISFGISRFALCQSVGIGTSVPNGSAQLDITSTAKGVLIPRMNIAAITTISNPAKGLLVYDSSKNQLMVNMGTASIPNWQTIVSKSGWNLIGNSGINPANQFIGNMDNQPLRFRINNIPAGELNPQNGNIFLGLRAGESNTTGYTNIAIGTDALKLNTNQTHLLAIGDSALYSNQTDINLAIGTKSMYSNTLGRYDIALGEETLYSNTTGSSNTAIGNGGSLWNNTIGSRNTAIGSGPLYNNTSGSDNIGTGYLTLLYNATGNDNVAYGNYALYSNIGSSNTAIGSWTLYATTNSSYNTAVGYNAGRSYNVGYNNTLIGAECDLNAAGLYNCIALGESVLCTANSQARIGNSATSSIGGFADWTNFSDGRYKKNVQENVKGIDFIMKLRPVTYQLDVQGISNKLNEGRGREIDPQSKLSIVEKEKMIFSGFVAQEVEKAAKEAGYDFSGVDAPKNDNDFYGLRYGDFVVPLVKTVQEQQVIIQQQQVMIDKELQTNNDLQKRVQLLEDQMKLLIQSATHKN